jgi:hypothetical protein
LQVYENAGGHLLQKNVEQSEQALTERMVAKPKIRGSSFFYDWARAEKAMSQTLDANKGRAWARHCRNYSSQKT